ncbi:MAG: ABC transporter permease subunit [Chloroflexota bacterium]|nr:ABC transporter permease subunit [Chloroflexota bacterium]
MNRLRTAPLAWVLFGVAFVYLVLPLIAMLWASLTTPRGFTLNAYIEVFRTPGFAEALLFSVRSGLITIVLSTALIVPTAYWVHLRLPHLRPMIEFFTLIPLVIPPILLTFGLIRFFNGTPLTNSSDGLYVLLLGGYIVISFPFFYRSIDAGLQAINLRVLTEAAQSLGAGWGTILWNVILPNLVVAILNGSFITFSIVLGEFTISSLLSQPAFSPYMLDLSYREADQATALSIISFAFTWLSIVFISIIGNRRAGLARQALTR